jgi:hypothetical protein
MSAGIQPGAAASEFFKTQFSHLKIPSVQISNLEFASCWPMGSDPSKCLISLIL